MDHALHAVHFATKPIAAVLVSGGAMAASDPHAAAWATMAGGALNALGIHGLLTVAAVALAAFLPFVGAVIAVLAIILAAVMLPRIVAALRRRRAGAT